jgi:hypothetical protein
MNDFPVHSCQRQVQNSEGREEVKSIGEGSITMRDHSCAPCGSCYLVFGIFNSAVTLLKRQFIVSKHIASSTSAQGTNGGEGLVAKATSN